MISRNFIKASISLLLVTSYSLPANAQLYRWVDAEGVVHYSDEKTSDKMKNYKPKSNLSTYKNTVLTNNTPDQEGKLPPLEERTETANSKQLSALKFPEPANRLRVIAFIQKVYEISREQKLHLSSDPQVALLMQVGEKYLPVLISQTNTDVGWSIYGLQVIKKLATDQHKAQIFAAFGSFSKYIEVIYAKKWHHEFKHQLVAGLTNNKDKVPVDWIKALSEFKREDARAVLIEYFKFGKDTNTTFRYLNAMLGMQARINKALPQAFENSIKTNRYSKYGLTPRALTIGHLPALQNVIQAMAIEKPPKNAFDAHALAQKFTNQKASPEAIIEWYYNNKGRIVFDKKSKLFIIK